MIIARRLTWGGREASGSDPDTLADSPSPPALYHTSSPARRPLPMEEGLNASTRLPTWRAVRRRCCSRSVSSFRCGSDQFFSSSGGGCATPFKGSAAGEDCTAIANVDSVSCTSGRCIVDSCAPGFVPSADSSACEKASRFGSSRLTVQGRRSRK